MRFGTLALPTLTLASGCVLSVRPLAEDFSAESPAEALRLTLDSLESAYAFTEWKGIDWEDVRDRLGERMSLAEGDTEATDRVWRELVLEVPDGHVLLWHDDESRNVCPEAAGDLGLLFSETADGEVVVVQVDDGSPAAAGGIAPGDALVARNDTPVGAALDGQPLHCFPVGLATAERRRAGQVRLLGRAAIGQEVALTLERNGAPVSVTLEADDDGDDIRAMLGLELPEERVDARMLGGDVGYLALGWEATVLSERSFRLALADLYDLGARRLVLDLRGNDGGTDQTAANIVGSFTDREWFYETITMYDRRTGEQAIVSKVWVEPQELRWDLPVAALIDGDTVSSGEGMAMMLARFDGVEVVGFEGTAASFGSSGSTVRLPDGWELTWPAGRSLDADGEIQLDSDASLQGGVQPTRRIPWTLDNRLAWGADPDGFAVDYAVEQVLGGW